MSSLSHTIWSRTAGSGEAGPLVAAALDRVVLSGIRAPRTVVAASRAGAPWSPGDVILTMDFHAPEVESEVPEARRRCREWARAAGLGPRHVFDLNAGVGSMVALEWGLIRPGALVAGCGRCLGMVGGVGALGLRLDTEELAQALVSGRIERRIPEARRVEIRGRLPRYAGAWDVARSIRYRLAGSVHGFVVEVGGDLETWPIGFRASVCGLLVEMGAAAALALPDAAVAEHFRSRGLDVEIPAPSGPGLDKAVLGADEIVATVSRAYADEAIIPGPEPVPIDGVFIGSCYGGHLADLAVAVEILKRGGGVNPEVRLTVSATTLETARGALNAGYYEQFLESGAILAAPGLGAGTAGGGAILGAGERMASTVEYHRADGPEAPDMVIVGPAAAAAAAVTGRLTDPAEFVS